MRLFYLYSYCTDRAVDLSERCACVRNTRLAIFLVWLWFGLNSSILHAIASAMLQINNNIIGMCTLYISKTVRIIHIQNIISGMIKMVNRTFFVWTIRKYSTKVNLIVYSTFCIFVWAAFNSVWKWWMFRSRHAKVVWPVQCNRNLIVSFTRGFWVRLKFVQPLFLFIFFFFVLDLEGLIFNHILCCLNCIAQNMYCPLDIRWTCICTLQTELSAMFALN